MATPENTFIASVHRHLPAGLYRMKNHNQFNSGIADCWYSGPWADLWIEYKFIVVPKRDDTLVVPELSALQKNWLSDRHAEGRAVGVIVGCKDGGVWYPGVSWQVPLNTREFRARLALRTKLANVIEQLTQG